MARIYHWQDTGSPSRTLTGTVANKLRTILLACLVNGYQDKPGAGWTLVHDATGGFSLRNGPGTGIINISDYDSSTYMVIKVTLLETITGDLTKSIPSGDNLRSGQGAPSATPHLLPLYGFQQNLSTAVWTVVADERSFCMYMGGGAQDATSTGYATLRAAWLYAGETSNGTFVAFGGTLTGSPSSPSYDGDGYTVLRDPVTGLVISGAGLELTSGGVSTVQATLAMTDPVGGLDLLPYPLLYGDRVSGSAVSVGSLRGVVVSPRHLRMNDSSAEALLGLPVSGDSRGKPMTIDGITLCPVAGGLPARCRCFLTDHADYW
ncbi:hypothetical protein [Pseudomonas sp. 273]|uniref:hypothetical protein n=1 Tax=Pseudomonas sp. 273 TaxID=75692 RepID=UPI0023D81CF4|nr:hypothetical protein [Pseudomonas sp. 273]